ncbi:MAG: DEAD H (Asp-Glu-Ala-Asp His) box polypeptide 19 (DBP5, ) [Marteilia pararefringens]
MTDSWMNPQGETFSEQRGDEVEEQVPKSHDISLLNKLLHNTLANENDLEGTLEVKQSDPNKPIFSAKTFQELDLNPQLLKAIRYKGYVKPSKIQEMSLPAMIKHRRDLIGQSQSGTGKTASFTLAALSHIDADLKQLQILVLAPTYELALQIYDVFRSLSQFMTPLNMNCLVRGQDNSTEDLEDCQIAIGTLGTTIKLLKQRTIDLKALKMLIIDEADVMIDENASNSLLCMDIQKLCPPGCQKLLFSATFNDEVIRLAESSTHDPLMLRLQKKEEAVDDIKNYYFIYNTLDDKYGALSEIYSSLTIGQSIIFCKTRKGASELSERMSKDGHAVSMLTGALDVDQRASIMQRFRTGKERVLITTNVTARGIDVATVNLVINYDLPLLMHQSGTVDYETYLHRVGRTGRFGKKGIAINFIKQGELNFIRDLENRFAIKIASVGEILD